MSIPTKRLANGFEMPVFGLGTWQMGGRMTRDTDNDDTSDIQAIQNAIDAGITHIDTAEMYADGHSEALVGEAIKGYDRSELFLVSKVAREHMEYDQVLRALEGSLQRLGVNYIDLYLLHGPEKIVSIADTMRAMDRLKNEGVTRNIGVSNFTAKQMEQAQAASVNKIVVNQLQYNLIYRETENAGLVEYCQNNDILFFA